MTEPLVEVPVGARLVLKHTKVPSRVIELRDELIQKWMALTRERIGELIDARLGYTEMETLVKKILETQDWPEVLAARKFTWTQMETEEGASLAKQKVAEWAGEVITLALQWKKLHGTPDEEKPDEGTKETQTS